MEIWKTGVRVCIRCSYHPSLTFSGVCFGSCCTLSNCVCKPVLSHVFYSGWNKVGQVGYVPEKYLQFPTSNSLLSMLQSLAALDSRSHASSNSTEAELVSGSLNGDASGRNWNKALFVGHIWRKPYYLESAFSWLKTWVYSLSVMYVFGLMCPVQWNPRVALQ